MPRISGVLVMMAVALMAASARPAEGQGLPPYDVSQAAGVHEIAFRSQILDEERRLLVRLPRDYGKAEQRYPVLLVLDADWHFTTVAADVDLLSECSYAVPHPILPLIVVGVVNADRNRDCTPTRRPDQAGMAFPTSGGAEPFRRFLAEEVLPVVDDAFRTSSFRILAGWSLGGLFVVDTILSGSPAFDAGLAVSPSLWWDEEWTLRQLRDGAFGDGPATSKQLVVTLGSLEKERQSMVARSVGAFLAHLKEHPLPRVTVEQVPIEGMGHNFAPKLAYFHGLASVFSDLGLPAAVRDEGLAAVDAYHAALGERYRCAVPVPEDVYGRLGWKLFEAGEVEEAGAVFRTWAERHPGSAVALASLGSFCRETGEGERALALFREAIAIEEQAEHPRPDFLQGLRRDIESLRAGR